MNTAATPLVSIVIRSMGRPTLPRALASLAAQDHPRLEVIVANARGAGHTAVPAAAGPHPVRFVDSPRRLTRPEAANAGQDAARGDWISFLDDDDELHPTHVSGLVAAAARASARGARFVHSLAHAVFEGGTQTFGQPMALTELYARNFIHMSSALWSRELVVAGARFDERCTTHQDWDFFIQCAQQTRFHFEPLKTFTWHADAGESGTWGGRNVDDAQIARMCALIFDKWKVQREALGDATRTLRSAALAAAQLRDGAGARARLAELFSLNPNDPAGLAILAGVEVASNNLDAALAAQKLAVAVRPRDAQLMFGLARLHALRGQADAARAVARHVLQLDPQHADAARLLA
ncbi:MAG: glycosyltransferase [Proteobacteria bacterium]|nr:glycosyltransferase [Pseudomonadota bacterium]